MMKTKEINLLDSIYKPTFRADTNAGIRRLLFQRLVSAIILLVFMTFTGCTQNTSSKIQTGSSDEPATKEGSPYADQYAIEVIPTQVFLDIDGTEFFRHQGFFEETELIKVLETKGVHL